MLIFVLPNKKDMNRKNNLTYRLSRGQLSSEGLIFPEALMVFAFVGVLVFIIS